MTTTFQIGRTYWTRSIGDSECIFRITVAKRTAKFLTTTTGKRLGITVYDGAEQVKPNGTYSMCAIITADREGEGPGAQATTNADPAWNLRACAGVYHVWHAGRNTYHVTEGRNGAILGTKEFLSPAFAYAAALNDRAHDLHNIAAANS